MNTTRVQSVSVIPTTRIGCNADCRYCVARMTVGNVESAEGLVWVPMNRMRALLDYGRQGGAMTVVLTSKAEPTLDLKDDPSAFLNRMMICRERLPQVDLHTNGVLLQKEPHWLKELVDAGLNMVTLSVASFDPSINGQLMGVGIDYERLIGCMNDVGVCVRVSTVCTSLNVPDGEVARQHVQAAKKLGADMVVFRECWRPSLLTDKGGHVADWIAEHYVSSDRVKKALAADPDVREVRTLPWGATVYDVDAVNVTFALCDEKFTGVYKSLQLVPKAYPNKSVGWRIRGSWGMEGDTIG